MSAVEDRLAELGLSVPEVTAPLASYVPAVISGSYVYTSGQLPFISGALQATGRLGSEIEVDEGVSLAQICGLNAIAAVKSVIGDLDRVVQVVRVTGLLRHHQNSLPNPRSLTVQVICWVPLLAGLIHAQQWVLLNFRWEPPSKLT